MSESNFGGGRLPGGDIPPPSPFQGQVSDLQRDDLRHRDSHHKHGRNEQTLTGIREHLNQMLVDVDTSHHENDYLKKQLADYKMQIIMAKRSNLMLCFNQNGEVMRQMCFSAWKDWTTRESKNRHERMFQMRLQEMEQQRRSDQQNAEKKYTAQMKKKATISMKLPNPFRYRSVVIGY